MKLFRKLLFIIISLTSTLHALEAMEVTGDEDEKDQAKYSSVAQTQPYHDQENPIAWQPSNIDSELDNNLLTEDNRIKPDVFVKLICLRTNYQTPIKSTTMGSIEEFGRIIDAIEDELRGDLQEQSLRTNPETRLIYGILHADLSLVQSAIEAGARVNGPAHSKLSKPLFLAVKQGDLTIVEYLIKQGAKIKTSIVQQARNPEIADYFSQYRIIRGKGIKYVNPYATKDPSIKPSNLAKKKVTFLDPDI